MKIFVIVRGFITEEAILATSNPYTVSHPHPAFTNREAALGFIEDLDLNVIELDLP
jgi:hypothetical protein